MHVQLVFHCFNFGALVCTLHFPKFCDATMFANKRARAVSEPTYKSWMVCTARAQAFRLVPWSAPCAFLNSVMQRCLPTVFRTNLQVLNGAHRTRIFVGLVPLVCVCVPRSAPCNSIVHKVRICILTFQALMLKRLTHQKSSSTRCYPTAYDQDVERCCQRASGWWSGVFAFFIQHVRHSG